MRRYAIVFFCALCVCLGLNAQGSGGYSRIDRKAVVSRNNPHVTEVDTLASLTVGNGHFAFTVDATGLQTFPEFYSKGMPLGTMSDWGWHSFPNVEGFKPEEAWVEKDFGRGHKEVYAAEFRTDGRQRDASNYFRQNPHRLHLGCVGLNFTDVGKISAVNQHLDMWNGVIDSRFKYDGKPYHVQTTCSPIYDLIASRVETKGPIEIVFRVPYPTGKHSDDGCDWGAEGGQTLSLRRHHNSAMVSVRIDDSNYQVRISWRGNAGIRMAGSHTVIFSGRNELDFMVEFLEGSSTDGLGNALGVSRERFSDSSVHTGRKGNERRPNVRQTARRSREENVSASNQRGQRLPFDSAPRKVWRHHRGFNDVCQSASSFWNHYWKEGAIVDFGQVADSRGKELERRVVLSQYLLAVNDGGSTPPQETGLTYNSWFGKFHLEMIWWHQAQFALWGHPQILERSLDWYFKAEPMARAIAERQGFEGVRWMKMTDPNAGEAPSNVGSYLIWQQPHVIYLAELLYRSQTQDGGRQRVIQKYKGLVDETARFMADFATYDPTADRYVLKGCIPAQETLKADSTVNPPLELSYWYWGLRTAQAWKERTGEERVKQWDEIIDKLSPLAALDSLYLAAETAPDTYTNIRYTSDHPAVLGAMGMLPAPGRSSERIMGHTLDWVLQNWNWDKTWGWDYPMVAMCAARLGQPGKAVDALLMDKRTNTYLVSGHNYQDNRLRVYLPGNGGLLTAVSMMLAGWDGSVGTNPGFPSDWNVRWEGLLPMP